MVKKFNPSQPCPLSRGSTALFLFFKDSCTSQRSYYFINFANPANLLYFPIFKSFFKYVSFHEISISLSSTTSISSSTATKFGVAICSGGRGLNSSFTVVYFDYIHCILNGDSTKKLIPPGLLLETSGKMKILRSAIFFILTKL